MRAERLPLRLGAWFFFLFLEQRIKSDSCYFNNFEANTRNITHCMSFPTEASYKNFIVFVNEIQAAIPRNKSCDFFAVLN